MALDQVNPGKKETAAMAVGFAGNREVSVSQGGPKSEIAFRARIKANRPASARPNTFP